MDARSLQLAIVFLLPQQFWNVTPVPSRSNPDVLWLKWNLPAAQIEMWCRDSAVSVPSTWEAKDLSGRRLFQGKLRIVGRRPLRFNQYDITKLLRAFEVLSH